ncbi:MinD-like ATPase involved in chromosome partitioning or flagellar assembly [Actinoallomurus bryophytorum]|uniref:MinD-like ATPase involved in chromosome partitioning or flagellar assembly n=1 Tax=Actinoallomurus bryophytorum TaxID=1490222 RepID=A0A543CEJ9_9ACTN|nr:MinD/ParA family protein [Actinoallomurus bryophytorum]TQL95367.1 MinD-like ATPase involved in chromosome partitioning or flagellar assembly [Actinoallomurus bryophytorum]
MTDATWPVVVGEDWQAKVLEELNVEPGMTVFPAEAPAAEAPVAEAPSVDGHPQASPHPAVPEPAQPPEPARPPEPGPSIPASASKGSSTLSPPVLARPEEPDGPAPNGRAPNANPAPQPPADLPSGPPAYEAPPSTRWDVVVQGPGTGIPPEPYVDGQSPWGNAPPQPVSPPQHYQQPVPPPPEPPEPGRAMHGDPLLRRVGRGVRRVVGVSAAQDVHDWTAVAAAMQQPVTTIRRIAVSSVRGGAGKTTVAVLIASALARHRQDRVLLIDADPGLGSLPMRFGMTAAPSLRDFAGTRPTSFEEVRPHLTRTDVGLWVLPGARGEMADQPLDLATYASVTSVLERFFTVVVIDCGVGMVGELPEAILASAHACVHVTPATNDGAIGVGRALDWMERNELGGLVPRTMAVFATHAPHARPDLHEAAALLRDNGVGVAYLPYDRHLASGGVLIPSLLAETTRSVALTVAAEAMTRANR